MDVRTKNRHWLETDIRPTEDLIRVWDARDLDIWSDECLQSVEQVLAAREVLQPPDFATSISWLITLEEPVLEEFFIHQIKEKM